MSVRLSLPYFFFYFSVGLLSYLILRFNLYCDLHRIVKCSYKAILHELLAVIHYLGVSLSSLADKGILCLLRKYGRSDTE
jgi:hypothetical protein